MTVDPAKFGGIPVESSSQGIDPAKFGGVPVDAGKTPMQLLNEIQPDIRPVERAEPGIGEKIVGLGETALALGTGLPAGIAGNTAGLIHRISGQSMPDAEQRAHEVTQALSYQPRTRSGQESTETAGSLLSALPPVLGVSMPTIGGTGLRTAGSAISTPVAEAGASIGRTVSPLFQRFVKSDEAPLPPANPNSMGAAATEAQRVRIERSRSLPVPTKLTKADITRDFEDQRFEREGAKRSDEIGEMFRQRIAQKNEDLLRNFDIYREETGATIPESIRGDRPIRLGRNIDTALRNRMDAALKKVDFEYAAARKNGDMNQELPVDRLVDYVNDNFSSATNARVIDVLGKELRRLGAATTSTDGLIPTGKKLPIHALEEIRQTIGNNTVSGPNLNFGPQIIRLIDDTTRDHGGNLYQRARRSYENYAKEFKDQSAVARILSTKPGTTDRAMAYEDIWHKAVPGEYSVQDFRNLRNSLLRAGPEGEQAFKDIQGATIDWLKHQATKTVQMDENGNPIVGASGMRKALESIGHEKLNHLFSKRGTQRLYDLSDEIDNLKIAPPGAVNTSGTTSTILAALAELAINSAVLGIPIPMISMTKGAMKWNKNRKEMKALKQRVTEHLNPNLD